MLKSPSIRLITAASVSLTIILFMALEFSLSSVTNTEEKRGECSLEICVHFYSE